MLGNQVQQLSATFMFASDQVFILQSWISADDDDFIEIQLKLSTLPEEKPLKYEVVHFHLAVFSRESDSRDSVVRSSVRSSVRP